MGAIPPRIIPMGINKSPAPIAQGATMSRPALPKRIEQIQAERQATRSQCLDSQIADLWRQCERKEAKIEAIFAEAHAFFARYDRGEPQPPDTGGHTWSYCEKAMEDYQRRVELSKTEEPFDTSKYIVNI